MPDPKNPKEPSSAKASAGEEDKVAAAYENISKKLESLRNGKEIDDVDEESNESKDTEGSEEELEEWKGPKPMKNPQVPDEEDDGLKIRRVKLDNGKDDEDDEGSEEQEEESDEAAEQRSEEDDDEKESKKQDGEEPSEEEIEVKPRKNWEPKENDPLDEEDIEEVTEETKVTEGTDGSDKSGDEPGEEVDESGIPESLKSRPSGSSEFAESESEPDIPERKIPQPDTLDDLTDESVSAGASDDTEAMPDKPEDEDDYFIPNLKGTGQRHSNMGYNTPIEREDSGESYKQSLRSDDLNKSSMDTNDPNNFFSQHNQPQPPKRASKFHLLILVVIGIVVIGFTVYILKGGFGELSLTAKPSPSPSPVESPSPTPTPTPEPNRSQYKLKVLNGSGKTGLAASVSAKLKELGYQTEKTGNATNSAFAQTVVRVKPALESFIPQIVKDLAPDFDAAGNTSLKESDAVDIEIILGAK